MINSCNKLMKFILNKTTKNTKSQQKLFQNFQYFVKLYYLFIYFDATQQNMKLKNLAMKTK